MDLTHAVEVPRSHRDETEQNRELDEQAFAHVNPEPRWGSLCMHSDLIERRGELLNLAEVTCRNYSGQAGYTRHTG